MNTRLAILTMLSFCLGVNQVYANTSQPSTSSNVEPSQQISSHTQNKKLHILSLSYTIQLALATQNYSAVTPYIHPIKGVRFSMYGHVQPTEDKVFSRQQFAKYLVQDRIKFTWGQMDGTGNLYITPLPAYLSNWVDAKKFNNSIYPETITINEAQGSGNSINNLTKAYPEADFVEFYTVGTEKFAYMDWASLRLVFESYQGKYYLVAIVNDQWTI